MSNLVKIVPYASEFKQSFYDVNYEWISQMFVVEDIDKEIISNPEKYILEPGGRIFIAEHLDLGAVGACALMKTGEGEFELTKMGIYKRARSLKSGEKLLKHVLNEAKQMNMKLLYLLTNADCAAAIHLYLKNGFVHDEGIMEKYGKSYKRCNVAMRYTGF